MFDERDAQTGSARPGTRFGQKRDKKASQMEKHWWELLKNEKEEQKNFAGKGRLAARTTSGIATKNRRGKGQVLVAKKGGGIH